MGKWEGSLWESRVGVSGKMDGETAVLVKAM